MFKLRVVLISSMLLSFILFFSTLSFAGDINTDLGNFVNKLGFEGNVTAAHAYQDQEAGYYSGGSLFLRNEVRDLQIVHLDAPTFRSGCGGIDLFAGGFSFISGKNITAFMQKIMSDAAGYALNLALETEVPEIAHAMQYIQQIAQKINNSNINSCNMAEDLVGGLWPKTRASQQQICQDIGTQGGANSYFSDWAAARQGCSTGDDFNREMNEAAKDPKYKNRVVLNKNLIWNAIQNNPFLSANTELAELFMSLSGTIIYDSNGKASIYNSLASNRDLIKALLYGGSANIYVCDESKACLNPKISSITISESMALEQQVINMINDLATKMHSDESLTAKEKGFLNTVNIPVLKFVAVSSSLRFGASALDLTAEAGLISKELLGQYLKEALDSVAESLTGVDYTAKIQERLQKNIENALAKVETIKLNAHADLADSITLINHMHSMEREVTASLSADLGNNLNFSGSK